MASMVVKGSSNSGGSSSCQLSPLVSVQEKGSRNKRKFRADPPLGDLNKIIPSTQTECPNYEFSAEKFEITTASHGQAGACDLCGVNQDHSGGLKLELGFSSAVGSSEVGSSRTREEFEVEAFQDADWSEFTESELEQIVLGNLDISFRTAIRKIIACGYTEEVAAKAVLRSGFCYGNKDTVSNIVDNALSFLRSGQDINPSKEHCFEDLQQLEKYILAEQVCVLREVRPFFSTGDAMWCLLMSDMNVSHACAIYEDLLSSFKSDGAPSGKFSISAQPQLKTEDKNSEPTLFNPCKPVTAVPFSHGSPLESPPVAGSSNVTKSKNLQVLGGLVSEKDGSNAKSDTMHKTFSVTGTSQSPVFEEKFLGSRKVHSGSIRGEYILRQKSSHLEKSYRTYGSTSSSRAAKLSGLGGFILEKKLKAVDSAALKQTSLKTSKAMGVDVPQENGSHKPSVNPGPSSPNALSADSVNTVSAFPNVPPIPTVEMTSTIPAVHTPPTLPTADTELSLSLPKSSSAQLPAGSNAGGSNCSYASIPYDKSLSQWVPRDKKDEMVLKLVPRVRELQNQLQEWTEWANQKVMQAARRLGKDKAELKALRQEKEEVERLKKEKQSLEDNTVKKLSEMENALCKASGQVERANAAVRKLEVENSSLRLEMEAAKLRAAESAANCQEVLKREKKTLMKVQSWEKQKTMFQEELITEKHRVAQLLQELEQAKVQQEQFEARWQQEEKSKQELLIQASSIRKEREQIESSAKSKEDMIKSKAEINLQRYKDDIQRLEKEISQLRLKTDSSKISALRRGIDGSYAGLLADGRNIAFQESNTPRISEVLKDFSDFSGTGTVKGERECVMCLSEEMSVVFLPCAHQVVCTMCNELHEKQGMKDCPSCRSPIQRRILVRYACP